MRLRQRQLMKFASGGRLSAWRGAVGGIAVCGNRAVGGAGSQFGAGFLPLAVSGLTKWTKMVVV